MKNIRRKNSILITGCAGFIGYHLTLKLLNKNFNVFGIDNINRYYDISYKLNRLKILKKYKNFKFQKIDLSNKNDLTSYFENKKFKYIFHLAAQAGVRYSLEKPRKYLDSNIIAFFNLLEIIKNNKPQNFIFASSSSVYGDTKTPFSEKQNIKNPISFYSTTKITNELFAENYSKIYDLKTTCLRLFTVYGPFGRPDMAIYKFFKSFYTKQKIFLRDKGYHQRDYTYVDDIIDAMLKCIDKKKYSKFKTYEVFNLGNSYPIKTNILLQKIKKISNLPYPDIINTKSVAESKKTNANNSKAKKLLDFNTTTKIDKGLKAFHKWFRDYNKF